MFTALLLFLSPTYPELWERDRFPGGAEACRQVIAYRRHVNETLPNLHHHYRHLRDNIGQWLHDSNNYLGCWEALAQAHGSSWHDGEREGLERLRSALGWSAWRDGRMPPRFPHSCRWREMFHRLRPFRP